MPEVTPEQLEALATGIGDLTAEVQNLNAAYQSKKAEIDAAVQESRDAVTAEAGRIDDFILGGEENFPYTNLHRNPYLYGTIEDSDVVVSCYNPGGHSITYELIKAEDSPVAQEIGRRLGGWNTDEQGAEVITEAGRKTGKYLKVLNPQFLRVTVNRNTSPIEPGASSSAASYREQGRILFTECIGGPKQAQFGWMTSFISFIGVETGAIEMIATSGNIKIAEGEVYENYNRTRFIGWNGTDFGAAYNDLHSLWLKDAAGNLVDSAVFIFAVPMLVSGRCSHFKSVLQRVPNAMYPAAENTVARWWAVL